MDCWLTDSSTLREHEMGVYRNKKVEFGIRREFRGAALYERTSCIMITWILIHPIFVHPYLSSHVQVEKVRAILLITV